MWTWLFWKQAIERAIKTAAQVAGGILTEIQTGEGPVDWVRMARAALYAVLYSILTSVGSGLAPAGPDNSPSLVETKR